MLPSQAGVNMSIRSAGFEDPRLRTENAVVLLYWSAAIKVI